jgi:hypothetical protein
LSFLLTPLRIRWTIPLSLLNRVTSNEDVIYIKKDKEPNRPLNAERTEQHYIVPSSMYKYSNSPNVVVIAVF